jgi:hypothetical protein
MGNVVMEDVLYALCESPYTVENVEQVALVRHWISKQFERENARLMLFAEEKPLIALEILFKWISDDKKHLRLFG